MALTVVQRLTAVPFFFLDGLAHPPRPRHCSPACPAPPAALCSSHPHPRCSPPRCSPCPPASRTGAHTCALLPSAALCAAVSRQPWGSHAAAGCAANLLQRWALPASQRDISGSQTLGSSSSGGGGGSGSSKSLWWPSCTCCSGLTKHIRRSAQAASRAAVAVWRQP